MLVAMDTIARKRVLDVDAEWELVKQLLPGGWEEMGRRLRAVRRLRGFDSVEALLRILLVHLADGCSLRETALRITQAGLGTLSAVGIFKRLRAAGPWLAWIASGLRGKLPAEVLQRHCVIVDATTVCEPGKTGSSYRVHWCVNLANLQCEFFELTDVHGGEKFARFPINEGDLVFADRGYSNPNGVDSVRGRGGHVLMRANPASLPMYDRRDGEKLNVLRALKGMRVGQVREFSAWVKGPGGHWHFGRLVAGFPVPHRACRARRPLAGYVLVWTSVPGSELSAQQALRCYRLRWQLELVFKRAKSIMGLGQLPKHSDASSRAWLSGKLLVAMLVEKIWKRAEDFSPWGYELLEPAQPLA